VTVERRRYLDVLRGVALLGILPVNIGTFALPFSVEDEPCYMVEGSLSETVAWHVMRFFFEYKFITIFSALFGVGMVLMLERSDAAGRSHGRVMLRRLIALWAFGVLHATLVWHGDILSYYAPVGLLLCWMARWPERRLLLCGLVLVVLPIVGMGYTGMGYTAPHTMAASSFARIADEAHELDPTAETETYRHGSFAEITRIRTKEWIADFMEWGYYFIWRIAGLFLVGMGLARGGWFLRPEANRTRFARLALVGLAAGIPLEALSSFAVEREGESASLEAAAELVQYVASLFLSGGYAGVVGLLVAGGVPRALRPFEAVGKAAFTNYLFQSFACTTVFYSQGFGLFGMLTRVKLWEVVAAVWAVQLVVSPLWLRWASIGPVEWVWRSITYWKWMPLRAAA
jgi:uncharacterized protein